MYQIEKIVQNVAIQEITIIAQCLRATGISTGGTEIKVDSTALQ